MKHIGKSTRSWRLATVVAFVVVLAAGPAVAQQERDGDRDPSGLIGAFQRLSQPEAPVVQVSALEILRDLAQGIEASGERVRLKEMVVKGGQSVLRLEVESALAAYTVKHAINSKPHGTAVEERKISTDPKSGRATVEYAISPRAKASEDERGSAPDEDLAKKDLGEHIQQEAARMRIKLASSRSSARPVSAVTDSSR